MSIKVIHNCQPKILLILGSTASGKTALATALALELNGEIVSADSRQVYKGMDIGTGKDLAQYRQGKKNIPYHLIDVAKPEQDFNLARYQALAFKAIEQIFKKGKLPIVVGGSGLYLQALVDNYDLAATPPRRELKKLTPLSVADLLNKISQLKPDFAARLNNSDKHNARRLARYLEIIQAGGEVGTGKRATPYDWLLLGVQVADKDLRERIVGRILSRLKKEAMVAEVQHLHEQGLSWERLQSFGLEYKFISQHLLGHLSYQEMIDKLSLATWRFARRQKTWFRRWQRQGAEIKWVKDIKAARKIIKKWQQ